MAIQWPLVLFSLLAGAGGAMLAFAGLSQLLGGSRTVRRRAVWCALALFVIGGLCSVAHLASPLNAISAVTNLLSFSGISIELMLLGASFIAGAAYLVLTREEGRDGAVRVVAVLAVIFGVAIGFFCGHGYVIDAQPTWSTETLPLAYLGTSLALGAFAYALVAAATKTPADKAASAEELGGKLWPAVLVCAVVDAVGILAYGLFLGLDAVAAQGVLFWGGAVACGVVGVLACAIDLLEDRASLYRLLASLYYQPLSEEQIDALAASDLAGLAGDSESPFAPAYRDLHGALRLRHTGTKEELAADFTGAFYGIRTREGRTAQPFESLFRTQGPGQLMGEARSEVYRELRAHQLRVPEGVDLPEDHLSFIFAYLGRLCDDAAAALRAGNEGQAAELLERQRSFFRAHVASWVRDFLAQARLMVETRFYRGVLALTEAFVAEEERSFEEAASAAA